MLQQVYNTARRTIKEMRKIYQEFTSANIIGATIEHNGIHGGDSGHGGYVTMTIKNIASTCMSVNGKECDSFELLIQGSSERETLLAALKMFVRELETHTDMC